jgi:hypothetical protein
MIRLNNSQLFPRGILDLIMQLNLSTFGLCIFSCSTMSSFERQAVLSLSISTLSHSMFNQSTFSRSMFSHLTFSSWIVSPLALILFGSPRYPLSNNPYASPRPPPPTGSPRVNLLSGFPIYCSTPPPPHILCCYTEQQQKSARYSYSHSVLGMKTSLNVKVY